MKAQEMEVAVLDAIVFASTDYGIDLVSLCTAGNIWRLKNGMSTYQLGRFMTSQGLKDYIKAASQVWDIPEVMFVKKVKSPKTPTKWYGHLSIAVLLAEQISPYFHAQVHKTFIEGKLFENRLLGGEEFKRVNAAIAINLPSPSGDNKGRYIQLANMVRNKCIVKKPEKLDISVWNQAAADQVAQALRVEILTKLESMISLGVIRDWEHLKEIVAKL